MHDKQPYEVDGEGPIYLIYSFEHRGWWGPARHGYPADVMGAGYYTADEATQICADCCFPWRPALGMPPEVKVPLPADFGRQTPEHLNESLFEAAVSEGARVINAWLPPEGS